MSRTSFLSRLRTGARPRPDLSRKTAALETLEGRSLLSHAGLHAGLTAAADVQFLRGSHPPHPGPILNLVGNGYAVKSTRFYPFYTGAKRPELNAAGAKAVFDGQGDLVLTGIVVGPTNTAPTSPDQEAFYVFGINRGGAPTPGPFPGRPAIAFDAVVAVSITQAGGVSGQVTDLDSGRSTPLGSDNILIQRDDVKVFVPAGLLPPTGAGGYQVNFWPRSAPPPAGPEAIASFVPEFRSFPVSTVPNPHLF